MERAGKTPGKSPSKEVFSVTLETATWAIMTTKSLPFCVTLGILSNILDQSPV